MSPPHIHRLPFPCAVYIKQKGSGGGSSSASTSYEFSHYYAHSSVLKTMPPSLRTRDLQEHIPALMSLQGAMRKACFLVLVAGDVAQCVSVANSQEHTRTRFLFRGSQYDNNNLHVISTRKPTMCSEFNSDYIPLHFYSTLASFHNGGLSGVSDLECGISLFPRRICEKDLQTLARWVDHNIGKSVHGSVWATNEAESYSEYTRKIHSRKTQRDV